MKMIIPDGSLVLLIGPSGAGKSTFARTHFKPTEVISSDACRALVADDENDQSVTKEAFDILHYIAGKRLAAGRLTVIDATNVQVEARKSLIALAREHYSLLTAIVFKMPEKLCHERNASRPDRQFGPHVVRQQIRQMRQSLSKLRNEDFRHTYILSSPEDVEQVTIDRQRLWSDRREDHGPFDIIGDIHGCFEELHVLLEKLGYSIVEDPNGHFQVKHPSTRRVVFLGDLVDRGPATPAVLRLVMDMVNDGMALCVPGNHDIKLLRKLLGHNVKMQHGIVETMQQLEQESAELQSRIKTFLESLLSHFVLDDGKLVVAHAGMKQNMQGRASRAVREFALYGETTGEVDEFGLPVRYNWASEYRGSAMVVYGHTPVPEPEWLNHTINIDTGCVFGGKLTALRYPENELCSVPAQREYAPPVRPILSPVSSKGTTVADRTVLSAQQQQDMVLDIDDVRGKRIIHPRLYSAVTIREENAIAALEVISRFAVNPRWLIYLPPTMSPSETSKESGYLEYPEEAFAYYRKLGVSKVVCEEKHMGSCAIVIVARDEEAVCRRFGVTGEGIGICYTRTGRHFFDDKELEQALLKRVQAALERANFWEEFSTDWVCLDCELMPWSVKAQSLVLRQYAAVGAASRAALQQATTILTQVEQRGVSTGGLAEQYQQRYQKSLQYTDAYRRYCWPVTELTDLKLAPFHVMATEGHVYSDKGHLWHMGTLASICEQDREVLFTTAYQIIDLNNIEDVQKGIDWWRELTGRGGEGMVVKPFDFIVKDDHSLIQPAIKCRGAEYLRIIYGPEYDIPTHLERLRSRGLGLKRSLALREFALGLEALQRFVEGEPLRRVHECVFGVLALESQPVDPRL